MKLLSYREAARFAGISVGGIQSAERRGHIKKRLYNDHEGFSKDDLKRWRLAHAENVVRCAAAALHELQLRFNEE